MIFKLFTLMVAWLGDATPEETLEQAQIAHARGLVSVLANDDHYDRPHRKNTQPDA